MYGEGAECLQSRTVTHKDNQGQVSHSVQLRTRYRYLQKWAPVRAE